VVRAKTESGLSSFEVCRHMLLNLADLALRGGDRYQRTFPLEIDPIVLGGVDYRVLLPGGVTITVDRVTGGYLAGVTLDANVYGPCARCLAEAVLQIHAEQQEFAPTAKEGWEETESSEFIQELMLDVEGLAREALVLALPGQVVCSETCVGLCSRCGTDLNKETCGCNDEEIDQRWSLLKGLELSDSGASEAGNERPESGKA
jgi:uncharacterized protein